MPDPAPKSVSIPPEPDPNLNPDLHAAWRRMFKTSFVWITPEFEQLPVERLRISTVASFMFSSTRVESSRNWCGPEIAAHGGKQFVQIYGEWVVPTVGLPPPQNRGSGPGPHDYKSAAWVGLDGDRRYLNSSLPQVGTGHDLIDGPTGQTTQYYPWVQWWARDQVALNYRRITNITVQPGVRVMGLVWAFSPTDVFIYFRNFAPLNQMVGFIRAAPQVQRTPILRLTPTVSGATAEWLVERPTLLNSTTELELFPDYTRVDFDNCVAGTASEPGPATGQQTIATPRWKRMYQVPDGAPSRTEIISMAHRVSDTAFYAHYGGF